jgi:hypothetical protein
MKLTLQLLKKTINEILSEASPPWATKPLYLTVKSKPQKPKSDIYFSELEEKFQNTFATRDKIINDAGNLMATLLEIVHSPYADEKMKRHINEFLTTFKRQLDVQLSKYTPE